MSIIQPQEVFDFEGYRREIATLDQSAQKWANSLVNHVNRVKSSLDETKAALREIADAIKAGTSARPFEENARQIDILAQRAANYRKQLDDVGQAEKANQLLIQELTAKLEQLNARYQALNPAAKDYAKQQRAILQETRVVTKAIEVQNGVLREGKRVVDAAEGSYDALRKQTRDLKKQLDGMPDAYDKTTGKINEQNRAAVALNQQYQKNLTLLQSISRSQGQYQFNVGNYPKTGSSSSMPDISSIAGMAGGGISKLLGAGAALAGLDSLFSAVSKVGDITLQFDSLDSALKVVSNDTALFAQRQVMLSRVSEDLGQDLDVVERNYTNLTASSLGTRLEGEATDKIFQSVTSTMGRLKKPSEDVQRALLAIGQMMSKGTVASEELRGQLGEVLPGSFNIAAKAMGVTTTKLSDMLKAGDVVASDFLPKFAAELEKTFNPNNERRVEGLAANLARLRNEGVEWVRSLDIGDTMGNWIGWIVSGAKAIREGLTPQVELSSKRFAEQSETLANLEGKIPSLMERYDELKSKSKLTADEQTELQSVINSLTSLVPNAATGFDSYGNALDINKGKVLSFTQAQRDLNAELNKQTIADLNLKAQAGIQRAQQAQETLNRGTEQKSFNWTPYAFRSDEEKKRATAKNEGDRRQVALSDGRIREIQAEADKQKQIVLMSAKQVLSAGGELDAATRQYVEKSGDMATKQLLLIDDKSKLIAKKQAEAADLFNKGNMKQQQVVAAEIDKLKKERDQLINPTLNKAPASAAKDGPSEAAVNKAKREAEARLREAMGNSKAGSDAALSGLANDRQDGLISEQKYIEDRLAITVSGIEERQALLEKAGKKETDDYRKLIKEKLDADTQYKRDQLKLDLSSVKNTTGTSMSGLDDRRSQGLIDEQAYVEEKHKINVQGIERQMQVLKEAGQMESKLYQDLANDLLSEQSRYHDERVKAEVSSWKKQLTETKDGLKSISNEVSAGLDDQLIDIEAKYRKRRNEIQQQMASGKTGKTEGQNLLHALVMDQLREELQATEDAYKKDKELYRSLVDDKITALELFKSEANRTPKEIFEAEKQIMDLRKALKDAEAEDDKKRSKDVAAIEKNTDDETNNHKIKNIEKVKEKRKALWDMALELAGTVGSAVSDITSAHLSRDEARLEKQRENELRLAGDSVEQKQRIEEQYAKRKAEIQRKQAVADRAAALFSIALNTAMGVASVLSTGGGTHYADLGISAGLLTAFVIATGAIQAAAVLAKPLPAFKTGKEATNPYTGPALAGEAGPELWVQDGKARLLDRPTMISTKRGDTIYTASETSAILAGMYNQRARDRHFGNLNEINQSIQMLREGRITEMSISMTNGLSGLNQKSLANAIGIEVGRAINNRPVHETIIDEEGNFHNAVRRGIERREYLNKRKSFK